MDDPELLHELLDELDRSLGEAGLESEVHVLGEHVVVVDVDIRCDLSDPVGVYHPQVTARGIAAGLAEGRGVPADWLDRWVPRLVPEGSASAERERLTIRAGDPSELLATLLASPEPVRHTDEIRVVLDHVGITEPAEAVALALQTYDRYRIGVDADDLLPDVRRILG